MRRAALIGITTTFLLAGCGQSSTPLSHAINALRAGDYSEYLAAKAENDEAIKSAIQPGDDLCKVTVHDLVVYSEREAIAKLDRSDVYSLPIDDRLLFAFARVGEDKRWEYSSFLSNAPILRALNDPGNGDEIICGGKAKDKVLQWAVENGEINDNNEARLDALKEWTDDTKDHYAQSMDDHMHQAVQHLERAGYSAQWPPKTDMAGYAELPTFQQSGH